jgi:hypothetical protein
MYTEICHYLLFYITFFAIFWISTFGALPGTFFFLPGGPFVFFNASKKRTKFASIEEKTKKRKEHTNKKKISSRFSVKKSNSWEVDSTISKILFSSFFFFLSISFFGTINNYICSDFSIYNTTTNSTADIPLFYKISATWSNHEGSLLLWSWLLSLSALFFSMTLQFTRIEYFTKLDFSSLKQHFQNHHIPKNYLIRKSVHCTSSAPSPSFVEREPIYKFSNNSVLKKNKKLHPISEKMVFKLKLLFNLMWKKFFHSTSIVVLDEIEKKFNIIKRKAVFITKIIVIFFISFCIMTSNPFLRTSNPSINSLAELNPILQDPILAIHPPCIYIGYVASAIAFSLCATTPIHFSKIKSILEKI